MFLNSLTNKLRKANETTDQLMNRDEDKYLVAKSHFEKLTSTLRDMLKEGDSDTEVRFNVNKTTYLDTVDLDCLKDAVSGVKPRFKVRIRHYAPNGGPFEDVAYLELKIKTETGFTKKTRIRIPASTIPNMKGPDAWTFWLGNLHTLVNLNRDLSREVLSERIKAISDVLQKYGFRKQIAVMYERRAYSNSKIRVTVDDEVKYLEAQPIPPDTMDNVPGWGKEEKLVHKVRNSPFVILEVKHEVEIPKWLKKLLKEVDAKKVGFSKYCAAVASSMNDQTNSGDVTSPRPVMDVRPLMELMSEPQVEKSKKKKDIVKIAAVVVRDKNFILVGKRRKNDKWGLPGGRFEDDEKKSDVALRETEEETGLKLKRADLKFIGRKTVETHDEIKLVYVFSAKHPGGEPTTEHDPDEEFKEWQWIRCEDGMLPSSILEDKINSPSEAAFEEMGLTKSIDFRDLTEKLLKAENSPFFVAVVPVSPSGKVLIGKRREDGIWTTPGGGAEAGEVPSEVALRELKEESGLTVDRAHLEWLDVVPSPRGFPVVRYLLRVPGELEAVTHMDPDHEVESWMWMHPHDFPGVTRVEKNRSRMETIDSALKRFHGMDKSMSKIVELAEKLGKSAPKGVDAKKWDRCRHQVEKQGHSESSACAICTASMKKGGLGSGIKGHQTQHVRAELGSRPQPNAYDKGKVSQERISEGVSKFKMKHADGMGEPEARSWFAGMGMNRSEVDTAMKMVASKIRKGGIGSGVLGHQTAKHPVSGSPEERYVKNSVKRINAAKTREEAEKLADELVVNRDPKIQKGGPGSGVQGHKTFKPSPELKAGVQARVPQMKNRLQTHLESLKNGHVLPNVATASGKPVVHDVHAMRAHGYGLQDHLDAIDIHHKHAKRIGEVAEKLKAAGKRIPKEAKEMVKFHIKQMRTHMKEHDHQEMRHNQLQQVKEGKNPGLKKSVTQMGGAVGDPDLDTGNFIQTKVLGDQGLQQMFYREMENFGYGDVPREFELDRGTLHLSKVDDGMYSGYFTRSQDGLLDNARVRIDKINIPDLVALCQAKEWVGQAKSMEAPQAVHDSLEMPEPPQAILQSSLGAPSPPQEPAMAPSESNADKLIRILSLINKLMG